MASVVLIIRNALAPLTRTRLFRALAPVVLPVAERVMARLTDGRVQLSALLVPSLVLHTTGAKSGAPRDTVLMYTPDGRGRAIVAVTHDPSELWTAATHVLVLQGGVVIYRGPRPDDVSTVRDLLLATAAA